MHSHDADRVVVGLRDDGLDHACTLRALHLGPREIVPERAADRVRVRARLVDQEPDAAGDVAEPAGQRADLDDRSSAHDAFEQLARRRPQPVAVQLGEETHRRPDGIAGARASVGAAR